MGKLIEVPAGKNVGQAMKEIIQNEAREKQLKQARDAQGMKIGNVMAVLLQEFGFDADHAVEIALAYASALAQATDTPKERFLEGLDKIWNSQAEAKEKQVKAQSAQLLAMAAAAMNAKQPIPPPVLQQMQILKVEIPPEMQAYIDAGTNGAASPTEVPVNEEKAAAEQPN